MRLLIATLFFLLAAWFVGLDGPAAVPVTARVAIDRGELEPAATRVVMTDPATTWIGGLEMTCSSCHALFESPEIGRIERRQHHAVVLRHGLNDRCENCHSTRQQSLLDLGGERRVPYARVEELCAKCHGPTFRDWEHGIHGKAVGSWKLAAPERRRLRCTECHDPHRPAFAEQQPLPPPRTLRMRATEARRGPGTGGYQRRNPLRAPGAE